MKLFSKIFCSLILTLFLFSCGDGEKTTPKNYNLDSLVKVYPDSVPLLVKQGNRFLDEYDYEEALKVGAKAFRLDTTNIDALFLYANAMNNISTRTVTDVANAQKHFIRVLRSQPQNKKAYIALASTYTQQGEFEKSFQYINEVLRMDKRYRDAYIMKGTNYLTLGKRDLAISSYETAVQQDPKFFEGYLQLAWIFTEDEKYQFALEYFRTAADLKPKSVDALYGIAYSLQMLEKYNESLAAYRHLIETDNNYYLALFNQAYIKQFHQNQVDSAIYYYQSAIDIEPQFVKGWHNLGLCYKTKGDKTKALESFAKALKYNPDFEMSRIEAKKLR
ncbi:MAG: tetratricopeptide repeat protein [Bacteroidota bacterium]